MSERALGLVIAALLAAGTANLVLGLGDGIGNIVERVLLFSRRGRVRLRAEKERPFDPYGLDDVPWDGLRLLAALAGVGLAGLLFWERSPYLAVLGLAAGYGPSLVRAYLLRRRREETDARIRHLIQALGGILPAYGGLVPALWAVASLMDDPVGRRLNAHLGAGKSGQEALEALAADFRSERLADLARALGEAGEGVQAPEQVLAEMLDRMQRDRLARAREAIGGAPVRLLIPMLFLLVPPILILALYPPVARLIALVSGAGTGTVGW